MDVIPGALGLTGEQVDRLLTTAGRAPSLHNSQPWRFRLTPTSIELHADPQRRVPVADPDDRELRIGCGAALFNLRLALHELGIRPLVTVMPQRSRPNLLAVVRAGGRRPVTPEQQRLLRAVPLRHTNRHPFSDVQVTRQEQYALRRAAQEENCWLHLLEDHHQRTALQHIARRAHEAQMSDPLYRAEFGDWTARASTADGVPAAARCPSRRTRGCCATTPPAPATPACQARTSRPHRSSRSCSRT